MIVSTMNDLPGYEVTEVFGEVFGSTVRPGNIGSQTGAAFTGGELRGMMLAASAALPAGRPFDPARLGSPAPAHARYFPQGRLRAALGMAGYLAGGVLGYLVDPVVALAVFLLLPAFYALTTEGLLHPWARRES